MFTLIRYIIFFILIMLGLFFLHKNNAWFQEKIQDTKLFFQVIGKDTSVSKDDIYNDINKQNFIDKNLLPTSTVKSLNFDKNPKKADFNKNEDIKSKISVDGIVYYTNLERKKANLPDLIKNNSLNKTASLKTDDMFSNQYFEHIAPDGETTGDLAKSVGYGFSVIGENLALGIFDTDKALVQAWMDSPGHRANILNPKYTEIGVAVGIGEYKNQRQWMAVQHFARPLPVCPEINTETQKNIDTEKDFLDTEVRELQKMAGVIESSQQSADRNYLNEYNNRVSLYNKRLDNLRFIIDNFNKTIVEYNACIKK